VFVRGPPAVPAVVAYRHNQRLQAREALIDDPRAARQAAVREYERDVEELKRELAAARLPFVPELTAFRCVA